MKEKILEFLHKATSELGLQESDQFTALYIANEFGVSRNSVSQWLNEYLEQGKVIKINTRPVYFYEVNALEKDGYMIQKKIYPSLEYIKKSDAAGFNNLIGADGSLTQVIESCKAAASYPPDGLPILLHGQTGTGKSVLARTTYTYAVNKKLLKHEDRFYVLNCSEYADNPELLAVNLFGVCKGAYTGADCDRPGLLELADEGMLFLDEVHCLKGECQEKLFLYMDQGIFHRVGDNEKWYHSKCRLIFATTAKPEEVLLRTLLRRIPIIVEVPSIDERSRNEKQALINYAFRKEAKEIDLDIQVSYLAYHLLMDTTFPGNVGSLINCVKASCAKAYINAHVHDRILEVHLYDLPEEVLRLAPDLNIKQQNKNDARMLNMSFPASEEEGNSRLLRMYQKLLGIYEDLQKSDGTASKLKNIQIELQTEDDGILYDKSGDVVNNAYIMKITDKILSILINKYSLSISNNDIVLISRYIGLSINPGEKALSWMASNKATIDAFCAYMKNRYPREYEITDELADSILLNLDIHLDPLIFLRFLLFIVQNRVQPQTVEDRTKALILCHGYSTASSIADAVNKLVGVRFFDAVDMQLDMSMDKVITILNTYLKAKTNYDNILFLVDMGALEEVDAALNLPENVGVGVMTNVSTRTALSVAQDILNGISPEEALQNAAVACQWKYRSNSKKECVILSVCATGIGTADKITDLFEKSLPCPIDAKIISYDFNSLNNNKSKDPVFRKYDVAFILGTMNPQIEGIPYMPLEELVMSDGIEQIDTLMTAFLDEEQRSQFIKNILKNFTLNNLVNSLTILNGEKVLNDVDIVVEKLERRLQTNLEPVMKIGLDIHIACLIERLILHQEVEMVEEAECFCATHQTFVQDVKEAFSVVKERYSVEIPDSEIAYIYNYIQ